MRRSMRRVAPRVASARRDVRTMLSLEAVDICIAIATLSYLLLIAADIMLDDLLEDDISKSEWLTAMCKSVNTTASKDKRMLAEADFGENEMAMVKTRIVLRIDLVFLCAFAAESLLRMFGFGVRKYYSSPLNVVDTVIISASIVFDILLMLELSCLAGFLFLLSPLFPLFFL